MTEHVALRCDCSICTMRGYIHVIVPRQQFFLQQGADAVITYQFGTRTARHYFCRTCGVQSYYVPRSHPDGISVNLHCLDGDAAKAFRIEAFGGHEGLA